MTPKKPAAFMSYAHSDNKYGQLTTLRERLSDEVQTQTGIEFPIFQDLKDIHWGQDWAERIENSLLDEITFLIPIITPSFFNSKPCREELERFIRREKKLERNDLILPIYFVNTPLLNEAELRVGDKLAEVIASRQYADWRELRHEPFTNQLVSKALERLAVQIREALPRIKTKRTTSARTVSRVAEPSATTTEKSDEQLIVSPTAKREPPTFIVDPWHRGDFASLSEAIKTVAPGTKILVRPGLYQEDLVINKPLEIIGDGALDEIVIEANGKHVILFQTTMGRIVNLTLRQMGGGEWYGVAIAQGRLEIEDCDVTSQGLSCVAIRGSADPRLRRNRIHNCNESGIIVYENAQGTIEDNEIFGNTLSGVSLEGSANPTIRNNRIHGNTKGCGVFVDEKAQGILEDNDIFGNALSGVQIRRTAGSIVRRNRIYENKQAGVYVNKEGQGIVEDNDIFANGNCGFFSAGGGNPIIKRNRINKNKPFGICIRENGRGTFEDNDLRENEKGAWSIAPDCAANITKLNNKE